MNNYSVITGDNVGAETLDYYINFTEDIRELRTCDYFNLDENGIPLIDYDKLFQKANVAEKKHSYGIHHTPVTTAQYGLSCLRTFLDTNDQDFFQLFLIQARWLQENLVTTPAGFGLWFHWFAFPIYKLTPPWCSAMAQGQGISVLVRAYQATHDQSFLDAAYLAFGAFEHDIADGGVSAHEDGYLWLEEFPSKPASHVLNGFIFALWGVYDLYKETYDPTAHRIWQEGVRTLATNLHRYEWYFSSRYDLLCKGNTSADYHRIHILQLKVMGSLTDERIFCEYSARWQEYAAGKGRIRRLTNRAVRAIMRRCGLLKQNNVV